MLSRLAKWPIRISVSGYSTVRQQVNFSREIWQQTYIVSQVLNIRELKQPRQWCKEKVDWKLAGNLVLTTGLKTYISHRKG